MLSNLKKLGRGINQITSSCDMKRILHFFIGLVTIGLLSISCSKDESNEKSIVGKWQSTSISYEGYEAGKLVYEGSQTCLDWYLGFIFKSDGTGQLIDYEGKPDICQMMWVIMGDKLIVTEYIGGEADDVYAFEIVEIKSDSMILKLTEEYTSNGIKYKEISTYRFKRI